MGPTVPLSPVALVHKIFLIPLFIFFQQAMAFEIISHKGVHNEECISSEYSCLSDCLTWKNTPFLENTVDGIRRAFELGAQRVEIDLQLSADGEIMVFHDAKLLCRTGENKFVKDLRVKDLKKLDIARNLKFLNIEDNPLKGTGIGQIPTLREVLKNFPGRGFLLNPKTDNPIFLKRLNEILTDFTVKKKTHSIESFSMWGPYGAWKSLTLTFPQFGERFSNGGIGRNCEFDYERYGWSGYFPTACRGFVLALSATKLKQWSLWGGPIGIIKTFHQHGVKIYLLHVENKEDFRRFTTMQFDGIITSRMEIVP
jgi:glycerophosphoryl diester phosphodiesterase